MSFTVSVITPCYNCGQWIRRALESVAAQSLPCVELIVIDDGSSDDSLEQVRSSGVPVRLLRTPRINAAGARNAGIEVAVGDWVAFLDADDAWYPHHLQSAARLLRGTDDVAYLAHCDLLVHSDGHETTTPPYAVAAPTSGLSGPDFLRLWEERSHFPSSGVVASRREVMTSGGFDITQVRRHDFELFLRLVKGRTWAYNPRSTWRYRVGAPQSISQDLASCSYYSLRAVLKNEPQFPSATMARLVRKKARTAMSTSFLTGDAKDRQRAWDLARLHLGPTRKLCYALIRHFPNLYRWIYRVARGNHGVSMTANADAR